MSKANNLGDFLTGVADAIRAKTGSSSPIDPQDFETEIANIPTGGDNRLPSVVDGTVTTILANDLSGATSIRSYGLFNEQNLIQVEIPSSVIEIKASAFSSCSNLQTVRIGTGVTSVELNAFNSCSSLNKVYYDGDIASWCGITFASSDNCNPLTTAKNLYINNERVTAIVFPNTTTTIKDFVLAGWNGTSVTIPESVTSIGKSAFSSCSGLTGSLVIPDSVTSIGESAFYSCRSLTSITIGNGVTGIGKQAFMYCSGLTSITITATTPPVLGSADAFNSTNNCPIYVPATSVSAYQSATIWSGLSSRIQAIPS